MKFCFKCKEYKSGNMFNKDKSRKSGLQVYCKDCTKKWRRENKKLLYSNMKKSYDKKRKSFVEYKKGLKCQQCGENHSACLVFHHRNPDKKEFNIAHVVCSSSLENIKKEIVKCDVLCANCHRKLHYDLKKK